MALVMANETATAQRRIPGVSSREMWCLGESFCRRLASPSPPWLGPQLIEGDRPVRRPTPCTDFFPRVEFKSTWNCVVVNGGVLEVWAGGSGWRFGRPGLCDPQGLWALVCWSAGCISLALHVTNCWDQTEAVGEVQDLCLSPAFLALDPAGS